MRMRGECGTLSEYNIMASTLPQSTPVFYSYQSDMPSGYSEDRYGPWPAGVAIVLKCQFASSHLSPTSRQNLKTVTLLIAGSDPDDHPLLLTGALTRLLAYVCTCKSGAGTNRACAHVCAMVIGLLGRVFFETVKKNDGRLTDLHAPPAHQPSQAGPPAEGRDRSTFTIPAPRPLRRTPNWRTRREPGTRAPPTFTSGASGRTAPPPTAPAHGPHSSTHPPTSSLSPPAVLPLRNVENTCYACATIQGLFVLDTGRYMGRVNDPLQNNFSNALQHVLNISPDVVPFDIVHLVTALNLCLPSRDMFQIGRQECGGEFLDHLLANVNLSSHISSYEVESVCRHCLFPQVTGFLNLFSARGARD